MRQHICSARFAFTLHGPIRKHFQDPEKIISAFIGPGATVIDIGCGPGYFTIPIALLTGAAGTVYAVDIQEAMLRKVEARAVEAGVRTRIRPVLCAPDRISVSEAVDFVLTFWMVHEVPDRPALFRQIREVMKPGSRYLLVEPKIHVMKKRYGMIIDEAVAAGLKPVQEVQVPLSRAMLFSR